MLRQVPEPRIGVNREDLTRPDWTSPSQRSKETIWLDKNENIDPELSEKTQAILADLSQEAVFTYPELGALYEKLAGVMDCNSNQLVLAAGSDGVIRTVFEAFVAPGDVVLHTDPTFAMYFVYSKMYAAEEHQQAYRPSETGPHLDLDSFLVKIRELKPRLICLPNPDSPTGNLLDKASMEKIISAAGDVGAVLLIDEAYFPISPVTYKDYVVENPHVIIARSFGKAWGAAGVRVGFGIAHPKMAEILHKVRPMYEIGELSAQFLFRLLDFKDDVFCSVERIHEGKEWFAQQMENLGYHVLRAEGNFIHIEFGEDAQKVEQALENRVLYRSSFSVPCLKGFSRFSVAPKAIMEQVASYIVQAVRTE